MKSAMLFLLLFAQEAAEVTRLIHSLGSEKPEERQRAESRLLELGDPALPQLNAVAKDPDLELRSRATSVAAEIERLRADRERDRAEKRRLISRNRRAPALLDEKAPGAFVAGNARIECSTSPFEDGIVLRTDLVDYLDDGQGGPERIDFDLVQVLDPDRRELTIERCGRCSPGKVLIRKTSGPIFPRIRGTHLWYSTSPVLFKAPKTGDERRVGDFTIRVDWPHLRVTCGHDWSREALEAAGGTFDVKVKGGDAPAPVGQMSGSSFSGGGRFQGGRRKYWCDCSEGPRPIAARPQKEAIRELQVVGERYALDQVEEIRYTFRKPIVEPFDFMPSEAIK